LLRLLNLAQVDKSGADSVVR